MAVKACEAVTNPVKPEPSPWNEPLNEPLPPFLTVVATVAIEADSTEPDTEVSKVIVVPSPLLRVIIFWLTLPAITPRSGKDAVVALSAREAVANGDRVFAIVATEAVWASTAVDADVAVPIKEPVTDPDNDPVNDETIEPDKSDKYWLINIL